MAVVADPPPVADPVATATAVGSQRDDRPSFRLRGRVHKLALTAHVMSSVGWFGMAALVVFCLAGSAVTDDRALADAFARVVAISPWITVPSGILSIATGALLGLGTKWGLFLHWWVVVKIVISAAVVVTDMVLVANLGRQLVAGARSPSSMFGPAIAHVVVLGAATVLSIFKPRARTPRGRRKAAEHVSPRSARAVRPS